MTFQVPGEPLAGILAAAIGMKHRTVGEVDVRGGHVDGVADQVGAHVLGHRPADDGLGVAVDHGGQVEPAGPGAHVSDVPDQLAPRSLGGEVAADVVGDPRLTLVHRGGPVGPRLAGDQVLLAHDVPDHVQADRGDLGILGAGQDRVDSAGAEFCDRYSCNPAPSMPSISAAETFRAGSKREPEVSP